MMKKICDTIKLLKKHGLMNWVYGDICWMALVVVLGILQDKMDLSVLCLAVGAVMIMWEASDAYMFEKLEDKNKEIADRDETIETLHKRVGEMTSDLEVASSLLTPNKANPIKSNRIVSDKTFAVRLRSFMNQIQPCDAASEEEVNYFIHVAEKLLSWQTKTVRRESSEAEYLQRLNLMPVEPEHQAEIPKEQKPSPKKRPAKKKISKKQETEEVENENKD